MEHLTKQQLAVESVEKLKGYSMHIGNTPEEYFKHMQGHASELSLALEAIEIATDHSGTIIEALNMRKEFLETLARNISAWDTSKDKREGLLPEVYLHNTYLFEKMTGLDPRIFKNLQKYAPSLRD